MQPYDRSTQLSRIRNRRGRSSCRRAPLTALVPRLLIPRLLMVGLLSLGLLIPGLSHAATFNVTTLADSGAGSLRQAVLDANASAGPHVIDFATGLIGTIELASKLPVVQEPVDLQGPGALQLAINANQHGRLLELSGDPGDIYFIRNLTLTGGEAGSHAGIWVVAGQLFLEDSHVVNNHATSLAGGGLSVESSASANVKRSIIAQNSASTSGGGIFSRGNLRIEESAIYFNRAENISGGGIWGDGELALYETTLSSNFAYSRGGGLYLFQDTDLATLNSVTIVDNTGTNFSGAGLAKGTASIPVDIGAVVIADNFVNGIESNCNLELGSVNQNNVSSDATCGFNGPSDQQGVDPRLLPLAFYGGPTPSHLPRSDSPLIDRGISTFCINRDQRGFARPVDGDGVGGAICDIGAVEYTPFVDDTIFADGFESGDAFEWTRIVGAPSL